jgi:nucleoside-diphosphate-sugar epimerase
MGVLSLAISVYCVSLLFRSKASFPIRNVAENRFLVTGASGFIGRALCVRLLELGAEVHGTSRRDVDLDNDRWSHSTVDLTDAAAVDAMVAEVKPDYVMHLASCVTGKREIEWIRETLEGNLQTAVNILVAAQAASVSKTVLAGSLEEPDAADPAPIASSPYAVSKWCASAYARTMHALYGTRSVTARIFMVYGPGQQDLRKLVPYVCLSAARSEAPELMSGRREVDWIYVDDVVNGLIRLAFDGPNNGDYVDIGSGALTTTGAIAEKICGLAGTGVAPILGAVPDRAMEQVRRADVAATQSALNWKPAVSIDDGLQRTYEWYRDLEQ